MNHIHDEDLRLAVTGSLRGDDLARVHAHIAQCSDCGTRGLRLAEDAASFDHVEQLIAEAESGPTPPRDTPQKLNDAGSELEIAHRITGSRRLLILWVRVLVAQGWLSLAAGATKDAILLARNAKTALKSANDAFQYARACCGEAYALAEFGATEEAVAAAVHAREIFDSLGDSPRALIARGAEAKAHANAGRLQLARQIFEEILAADPAANQKTAVQHSLVVVKMRQGDLDGISELLDAAETGSTDRLPPGFALRIREERALLAAQQGFLEEALTTCLSILREVIELRLGRDEMVLRCDIADLLTAVGRHEEAAEHATVALRYFSREGVGPEFRRAILLAIVRDEAIRNSSDVYRGLVEARRPLGDSLGHPGDAEPA